MKGRMVGFSTTSPEAGVDVSSFARHGVPPRITGLPVAHINAAARDLDIATYDAACRCWRVEDQYAVAFIAHLVEVSE